MAPFQPPDPAAPKLLDQVRARIRVKHYSIRTEAQYVQWIKRFIYFHGKRHPREMGAAEVEAFLSDLAVTGGVSASTQNQALSALLFLYREVLEITLPWLDNVTRAKPLQRLPVVLTPAEVRAVLDRMDGVYGLMARLLYGTGMRLMECVRLRVKDVDFGRKDSRGERGGKNGEGAGGGGGPWGGYWGGGGGGLGELGGGKAEFGQPGVGEEFSERGEEWGGVCVLLGQPFDRSA